MQQQQTKVRIELVGKLLAAACAAVALGASLAFPLATSVSTIFLSVGLIALVLANVPAIKK